MVLRDGGSVRSARSLGVLLAVAACNPGAPGVDDTDEVDTPDTDPADTVLLVAEAGTDVVVEVGAAVVLDAGASRGAVKARWSFGDGSDTEPSETLTTSHAWAAPGHYRVGLEVFGEDDRRATDTVLVTVIWPVLDPAPAVSSTVVVGAGRVWVALPDFGAVAVVDPSTRTVEQHLSPCPAPRRLSFEAGALGGGRLAVSCEAQAPGVVVYDITAAGVATELRRVNLTGLGISPFGVVLGGEQVVLTARERASETGLLLRYALGRGPDDVLRMGTDLRGLAYASGAWLVSRARSPDEAAELWAVTDEAVPFGLLPDPGPDSDTNARGVPTSLDAVAIRPDGRVAVVAGQKANVGRGLVRDGLPLTHETTLRADLRAVAWSAEEGERGAELGRLVLDDRDLIAAVAFHPRGDWLYAVTSGSQTLEVIDSYTLRRTAVVHGLGIGLDGVAVDPDGATAYVHGRWSRTLAWVDLEGGGDAPVATLDLKPGAEVLSASALLGAQVFHTAADPRMTQDSYVSCASCHLDGEQDGRVWDFTSRGEGLRNTISLRGMSERVGLPIHWSGNFDEVQDFEHDIRGPQAGRGFLSDADWAATNTTLGAPKAGLSPELDGLAAWVEGLQPLDVPWDVDVSEGEALFRSEAVGCAECHPEGGSSSRWLDVGVPELIDVGTIVASSGQRLGGPLLGLDVPDLRGLWATAPYLHDGSARTLREVLVDRNPGDLHGITQALSPEDLDALEQYLRAL